MDQCWHNGVGIELEVLWSELLPCKNVDVVTIPWQVFFGQVKADFGGQTDDP
jgi:hypothetical protein